MTYYTTKVCYMFFFFLLGLLRATVHWCRFAEDQESKEEDPKKV
jgi:hypothetical protein